MAKSYLTKEGHKKLKEELSQLKSTKRSQVTAKIKEARDLGDVLENTVYDTAIEEQNYIESRIKEIEELLNNVEVISRKSGSNVVVLGSMVVVESEDRKDSFMIVGSAEANPMKRMISHESPVGAALLGAKVGQVVKVRTPIITAVYKVIEIK